MSISPYDTALLFSITPEGIEKMVKQQSENQNLFLNIKKTKILRTDKAERATNIIIGNDLIEEVNAFDYLGYLITKNGD